MKIVLGSLSTIKLLALGVVCKKLALDALGIAGVATSSGQNEQPVGFTEIYAGAHQRAHQALHDDILVPDIGIGIESGIVTTAPCEESGARTFDVAVIVALTRSGKTAVTVSKYFEFPDECVAIAAARGFETTTVGSVIEEQLGGKGTDPHEFLSGGATNRVQLLQKPIAQALNLLSV